jgi:ActR/RegA family two-component response regulator
MTGSDSSSNTPVPFKVLVLGGSYGGLAAALDVVKLGKGISPTDYLEYPANIPAAVDVTIVDERDGFCKPPAAEHIYKLMISSPLDWRSTGTC